MIMSGTVSTARAGGRSAGADGGGGATGGEPKPKKGLA